MQANTISIRNNVITRALGALSLLCACGLSQSPASAQTAYLQTATSANRVGNWTALQMRDSNPNNIYFVTSNWNPPGSGGVYNNHPTGVWFNGSDWAIFNQDGATVPLGASFNVFGAPANTSPYTNANCYVHTATASNSAGDYTVLDNVHANGNPWALIWVTPNWNPGNRGGVYDNHNIGVWYDSAIGRWAIFNQDRTAIPAGASFNVYVQTYIYYPDWYVHTATSANIMGNFTVLNDSRINGVPGHLLLVTPNWNPPTGNGTPGSGVYNNHAIGVWYDSAIGRYAIFNQDITAIPSGASFNVMVVK
jgi:hypothetical protein